MSNFSASAQESSPQTIVLDEAADAGSALKVHHPVNQQSLAYWLSKRGDRLMPARADLDPSEIPNLLPHTVLMDVARSPLDFRYRLIGTTVEYHLAHSLAGQWMSAIPYQRPGSVIWSTLEGIVNDRRPVTSRIPYIGPHKDYKTAEDMIMPLAADGETVDMLFVTVAYSKRAIPPNETLGDS